MAQSTVVDRLSILTYLSSLYHVLAEDGKERKISEDSGVSVEEEESVCSSSCSSSSGYDSPTKVEQEEEEAEEKKAEKVVRRGGADAKRGGRRLVKSMIEVGEERETPFSVALRKFNTLAKSQTQLAGEACRERSLESCGKGEPAPESLVERSSPGVRERVSEWGSKTSTSCPPPTGWEDSRVSESPQPLAALVTRSTQTEEERRSASVQTSPLKPAQGGGWSGTKTHQRRQSIHSRAQAFLHDDGHPSLPNIPRGNNNRNKFPTTQQSPLTLQSSAFGRQQHRNNRTGGAPPCLQVAPLHRQNPDPAHSSHQPQSLTVLPCRPPSETRQQEERLWRRTPACEEEERGNYQRMDTLQFSHRGLQPTHRSASSPQLAQRLTAYPRQAAAILNHPKEGPKLVGHPRKADGVPPMPSHPQQGLSPFPNYPQVLGQGPKQVSGYPRHGNKCTTAPYTFPHPSFSTLV